MQNSLIEFQGLSNIITTKLLNAKVKNSQVILWIVLPILTKFLQKSQIGRALLQEVAKQICTITRLFFTSALSSFGLNIMFEQYQPKPAIVIAKGIWRDFICDLWPFSKNRKGYIENPSKRTCAWSPSCGFS